MRLSKQRTIPGWNRLPRGRSHRRGGAAPAIHRPFPPHALPRSSGNRHGALGIRQLFALNSAKVIPGGSAPDYARSAQPPFGKVGAVSHSWVHIHRPSCVTGRHNIAVVSVSEADHLAGTGRSVSLYQGLVLGPAVTSFVSSRPPERAFSKCRCPQSSRSVTPGREWYRSGPCPPRTRIVHRVGNLVRRFD